MEGAEDPKQDSLTANGALPCSPQLVVPLQHFSFLACDLKSQLLPQCLPLSQSVFTRVHPW